MWPRDWAPDSGTPLQRLEEGREGVPRRDTSQMTPSEQCRRQRQVPLTGSEHPAPGVSFPKATAQSHPEKAPQPGASGPDGPGDREGRSRESSELNQLGSGHSDAPTLASERTTAPRQRTRPQRRAGRRPAARRRPRPTLKLGRAHPPSDSAACGRRSGRLAYRSPAAAPGSSAGWGTAAGTPPAAGLCPAGTPPAAGCTGSFLQSEGDTRSFQLLVSSSKPTARNRQAAG